MGLEGLPKFTLRLGNDKARPLSGRPACEVCPGGHSLSWGCEMTGARSSGAYRALTDFELRPVRNGKPETALGRRIPPLRIVHTAARVNLLTRAALRHAESTRQSAQSTHGSAERRTK